MIAEEDLLILAVGALTIAWIFYQMLQTELRTEETKQ